jgi:hypothetical protein
LPLGELRGTDEDWMVACHDGSPGGESMNFALKSRSVFLFIPSYFAWRLSAQAPPLRRAGIRVTPQENWAAIYGRPGSGIC